MGNQIQRKVCPIHIRFQLELIGILKAHASDIGSPMVSITVDHVEEDTWNDPTMPHWKPWSSNATRALSLTSSSAPGQPLSTYHLACLTPPLLTSIFEHINFPSLPTRVEVRYWLHRLWEYTLNAKHDAYLDLLELIAYSSSKARYSAATLLATFFPRAIGHVTVSRPFPYDEHSEMVHESHPYAHQFVPWQFHRPEETECRVCSTSISGFGLMCPFCLCTVHIDCYDHPDGSRLVKYPMASDPNVKSIAMYRFSNIFMSRNGLQHAAIQKNRHAFRPVNLFTLSLCFFCKKPLWGCVMQGVKCTKCFYVLHSSCASAQNMPSCSGTTLDSSYMTIQWSELRRSCVEFYGEILGLQETDIASQGFEDVSVICSVLWLQTQMMTKGVAFGTIVIMQNGRNAAHMKEHRVDPFELHYVLEWCQLRLASQNCQLSLSTIDYLREDKRPYSEHSFMFDWPHLAFVVTALKVPYSAQTIQSPSSINLLVVNHRDHIDNVNAEDNYPFEVVSISHMRDVLGHEFNVHWDVAAQYFLSHLHHLGFFERSDMYPHLFGSTLEPLNPELTCSFPIPLGLDSSADVETLFSSVEACLSELDLNINEFGLLLLTRRLWPSGMSSEYALKRLARNVFNWVVAEVSFHVN